MIAPLLPAMVVKSSFIGTNAGGTGGDWFAWSSLRASPPDIPVGVVMEGAIYDVQPMAGAINELIKALSEPFDRTGDINVSHDSSPLYCVSLSAVPDNFNHSFQHLVPSTIHNILSAFKLLLTTIRRRWSVHHCSSMTIINKKLTYLWRSCLKRH